MVSDLFWAFQPKRLIVPSLPLWLNAPAMPKLFDDCAVWLLRSVASSMFSISPEPNVGVGMRKMMLPVACACENDGSARLVQVPASTRPTMTKRSSTPPFGREVSGLPNWSKKKGKRTSRTGPQRGSRLALPEGRHSVLGERAD